MSSTQDEQALQAPASYPRRTPLAELQQAFLDLRLTMFIHYNMATYQDREWGDDKQPISLFNPTNLDTDQWADAAVNAHMQGAFLTTKHHDGFCIWPTKTGTPSVLHTPSQVDVVDAYAKSFRKRGLKVGLYYSILDKRNDIRHFNVTREKIQLVKAHLTELLTNYGDIFMIIFDGWSAPWSRIPYSEVPFQEIYRHVKSLQPDCLVTDLNASDFHPKGLFYGDIKAFEQNAGQVLPADNALPSFSCVTLTDGWFWKLADIDAELKSTYQVVHDWLIPQNERHCTLIVNAPPDREGRLAPNVVERLQEIGRAWQYPGPAASLTGYMAPVTTKNLAEGAVIHSSDQPDGTGPDQANNGDLWSSWYTPTGEKNGSLQIDFHKPTAFNRVLTCEPIGHYSDYPHTRIGRYWWQAYVGEKWITLVDVPYEPGSDHPCVLSHWVKRTIATKVRLWFEVIEDTAHINLIAIYDEPERT